MKAFKRSWTLKFLLLVFVAFVYYILTRYDHFHSPVGRNGTPARFNRTELSTSRENNSGALAAKEMVLAVVACGERLQETLTMIKSCLLFSPKLPIRFVVVADEDLVLDFKEKLEEWRRVLGGSFTYEVLSLQFPEKDAEEWRKLFKPCASQRLFLPAMLTHIDSLIYVDTDTLFLSPITSLWKHFSQFNSSQMAALALEHEDPHLSWYTRFAKHPFYGKLGVNSGVMLMNLTRMRAFGWHEYVRSVHAQWRAQLTWGDQDIVNIIFARRPDALHVLACDANYRPDQCQYGDACAAATARGARVLHGSRGAFHEAARRQPAFAAVHRAVEGFALGDDPRKGFLPALLKNLREAPASKCGELARGGAFTKIPREVFGGGVVED